MLIGFRLLPLANIQPWGEAGSLTLHWFGLTDGCYWIEVGENRLFEYSEGVRAASSGRCCEYQVVRLYEDLMNMLPDILEPVPDSLIQYLSGSTAIHWRANFDAWVDRSDALDRERFYQLVDDATTWSGARHLDSGYLSPSTNISIWSDAESVHFEWDNRNRLIDGKCAWSALQGTYQIPRAEFVDEIRSFHDRLMDQMSERVQEVLAGGLPSGIGIDMPGLVREHEQRSRTLEHALRREPQTDWRRVEAAIDEILHT